jgi:hypothetical protein
MPNYPTSGQQEVRRIIKSYLVTYQNLLQQREGLNDTSEVKKVQSKIDDILNQVKTDLCVNKLVIQDPITGESFYNSLVSDNYKWFLITAPEQNNLTDRDRSPQLTPDIIYEDDLLEVRLDKYIYDSRPHNQTHIYEGGDRWDSTYKCLFALALKDLINNDSKLVQKMNNWNRSTMRGGSSELQLNSEIAIQSFQLTEAIVLYNHDWNGAYYVNNGILTLSGGCHRQLAHVLWGDPFICPHSLKLYKHDTIDLKLNDSLLRIERLLRQSNWGFKFKNLYSSTSEVEDIKRFFNNTNQSELEVLTKFLSHSDRRYIERYTSSNNGTDVLDIEGLKGIIEDLRKTTKRTIVEKFFNRLGKDIQPRSFIEGLLYEFAKDFRWGVSQPLSFQEWYDKNYQ